MYISVRQYFPSVLWQCWLGDGKGIRPVKKTGCWFADGDILTGTLHVLQLQLLPPFPSSLASIKPANPYSPGKLAVKTGDRDSVQHSQTIKQVSVWVVINFLKSKFDRLLYFSAEIYFIKCPMAWAAVSFLVFVRHYFKNYFWCFWCFVAWRR